MYEGAPKEETPNSQEVIKEQLRREILENLQVLGNGINFEDETELKNRLEAIKTLRNELRSRNLKKE